MMSNAKLVLLVIVLWTGFFTLVNSDQLVCDRYNIPKTAVWVPRDTCEVSKSNPCNAGYQLQIQTTCNDNGGWDVEPSCQATDCGDLPQGTFSTGTATSGTTYPNVANYTCDVGYEIVSGNSTISCLESGQWDDDNVLVCQAKDCGDLPLGNFSTGTATSGTTYPNVADYTCDEGYGIVSGNEQISCLESGQWDDDIVLVCQDCFRYTYNRNMVKSYIGTGMSPAQTDCEDNCNNLPGCSVGTIDYSSCYLYPAPIIFIFHNTDLNTCKTKCIEMEDCAAMGHSGSKAACYILNVTQENFPVDFIVEDGSISDIIGEKICL